MDIKGDEMKALDFLYLVKEDTACEWNELDEAIAELEAQENKSCWGCKHCLEDSNETSVWLECRCPNCPMEYNTVVTDPYGEVDTDFCCNRFEPKEQ